MDEDYDSIIKNINNRINSLSVINMENNNKTVVLDTFLFNLKKYLNLLKDKKYYILLSMFILSIIYLYRKNKYKMNTKKKTDVYNNILSWLIIISGIIFFILFLF